MENVFNILYERRENPLLFFGGRGSLSSLHAFICGYAEKQWEIDNDSTLTFALHGFQEFVEKRYGFREGSSQSWNKIIEFYSFSDHQAFETFYKLLDEFLQSTGRK